MPMEEEGGGGGGGDKPCCMFANISDFASRVWRKDFSILRPLNKMK